MDNPPPLTNPDLGDLGGSSVNRTHLDCEAGRWVAPAAQRSTVYPVSAPIFHWCNTGNMVLIFETDKEVRYNDVKPASEKGRRQRFSRQIIRPITDEDNRRRDSSLDTAAVDIRRTQDAIETTFDLRRGFFGGSFSSRSACSQSAIESPGMEPRSR